MNVSIDLGSCGFRAGLSQRQEILNEPMVVAYGSAAAPVVGAQAEQMIGRHPGNIRIAFPMEGSIVRDFDALVDVLKYIVTTLVPRRWLKRFNITIAHPGHQSPVDKKALDEAARMAGARRVQFVEATLAAARGAGLPMDEPVGCLVVDLGGGTTEVSLISLGGIVERRSLNQGGRAIDQEIVDQVQRRYAFAIGLRTAEQLKRWACQPSEEKEFTVRGRNLATGLPDSLRIPRSLVEESLHQYTDQILGLIRETMEACPPELVGDVMDRGLMLVGGGAYMQTVLKGLQERTEVPVVADPEPDTCVIRGLLHAAG
jgi:rod shape-determining protein MreB